MTSRGVTLLTTIAAAAVATTAPLQLASDAAGGRRAKVRVCTKRSHPPGCIQVPPGSRRDPRIDPGDRPTVAPYKAVNGGGVGGTAEAREEGALDWASGFTGGKAWAYRDERFVEEAYASKVHYVSPRVLRRRVVLHRQPPKHAPRGTLMLFRSDPTNRYLGHVGLSVGDGLMLSALETVRVSDVAKTRYWKALYLGWAHAPSRWPGRLPTPYDLVGGVQGNAATFVAPSDTSRPLSGVVLIAATAPVGAIVRFAAYYSDAPERAADPYWHELGAAAPAGSRYTLAWDTRGVPDQGSKRDGTVTLAAVMFDGSGKAAGVGDYVRIVVRNGG